MVGLATNHNSASIKRLNVTIARRLDTWLQCVAQSHLLIVYPRSDQHIGSVQETVDSNDDCSSDSLGYLHNILQLGTRSNKFLITVDINSIPIEMEVDSGAEHSTVPLSLFEQRLAGVCKVKPSKVSLYQYDKSPLTIAGECQATVKINSRVISAVFVVDVQKQFPLLGRDWMALLDFDLIALLTQTTAIHQNTADVVKTDLIKEFAEVFQSELGVLRGIEATVVVHESATPRPSSSICT